MRGVHVVIAVASVGAIALVGSWAREAEGADGPTHFERSFGRYFNSICGLYFIS